MRGVRLVLGACSVALSWPGCFPGFLAVRSAALSLLCWLCSCSVHSVCICSVLAALSALFCLRQVALSATAMRLGRSSLLGYRLAAASRWLLSHPVARSLRSSLYYVALNIVIHRLALKAAWH